MAYILTTALKKLIKVSKNGKRIHGVQGGTSASKTISIEQIFIDKSQSDTTPKLSSITSESIPHLKRGAIRDFKNIMQENGYWEQQRWNATDFIYTFPLVDPKTNKIIRSEGSKIEFFSLDQPHKVRGPRRHRLFINELNNIAKETFEQLEVRTSEEVWADWNPVEEFYYHEEIMKRDDADLTILTYKDNEGLPDTIVKSIEARKNNTAWWRVYGMGLPGAVEGRIFTDWQIVDEIPHEARLERYGLDFGYSNDPTSIVAIYSYNGGYILDEITYQKGLSNKQIADIINNQPQALVVADSSEPKSIDELRLYGVNILPATKGQGSVNQGIQYVQDQKISITKRSVNGLKEYRNYMWMTDKEGRIINTPVDMWNHFLDATRYGFESLRPKVNVTAPTRRATRQRFHI